MKQKVGKTIKRVFLNNFFLEGSLPDQIKKKKLIFRKEVFSTAVPISGPGSGVSKQLVFALTFVVFST